MEADTPLCACHGVKMLWQKDRRCRAGGYWCCREKRWVYNQTRRSQRVAWVVARIDSDPIYRIKQDLLQRRRRALKRKAMRHLPREERLGTVPDQRHSRS